MTENELFAPFLIFLNIFSSLRYVTLSLTLCFSHAAPQVIRKIRGESFGDASGHLKLWCQFFNVLSDSVIKWYKNEEEITQVKRT